MPSSKKISIYNGLGAGKESIDQTLYSIQQLQLNCDITLIHDKELLQEIWTKDTTLLIMPGGADLPYVAKLRGKGNEIIKNFVKSGGSYLGICAGGYYGSSYVEFDKGGPLEVVGKRELGFFPGKAIGPILATYDYRSNSGARSTWIQPSFSSSPICVYSNGGSHFEDKENSPHVEVLAKYCVKDLENCSAIVKMKYGKGVVILSGVHFEFAPELLNPEDPHLQIIIPELKKNNAARKNLVRNIFEQLINQ